jgi:hypothetical protein
MKREARAAFLCAAATLGALTMSRATLLASPEPKRAATPVPDPLREPLRERINGKKSLDDVRIDVDWLPGATPMTARVWGNGVGIWQRRLQFVLSRDQVIAMLKALREARFGAMIGRFGSDMEGEEDSPARLRGRIVVRLGTSVKSVVQLGDGDQSPEFAALAEKLIAICAAPAAKGKGTPSLSAGLRSVADNELFPETLSVVLQREESEKDEGEAGNKKDRWILRLEGRSATARRILVGRAAPSARRLVLSETDFRELAKILAAEPVESLPTNLYATAYTDLRIRVLSQSRNVMARRFVNMTPETHGAEQKAFDRIVESLRKVLERVERDGTKIEESRITGPAERESEREREEEREREKREERDRERREKSPSTPRPAPIPTPSPKAGTEGSAP